MVDAQFPSGTPLSYPDHMPKSKDVIVKAVTTMHRWMYKGSSGRILSTGGGMPVVVLTTIGRKTGQRRQTMLTAPLVDDDRIVLVGSYGGDDRHPAWLLNLRDNPAVEVDSQGSKRSMTARIANATERQELWPQVVAVNPGYAGYQEKTDREIPVVIVEP